jgi:hypothetical protein
VRAAGGKATGRYTTTVAGDGFAVRIDTDDLLDLVRDQTALDELQALLDRHLVLHISPRAQMGPEAFGCLAVHLGMPTGAGTGTLSPDYPFITAFAVPDRPAKVPDPARPPRPPDYIESLHHDGISAYSMQATFDTVESPTNLWCDMRAAYRSLPDGLRQLVDTGHARHGYVPPPGTPLSAFPPLDPERAKRRPLRIRHPRTGEPLLYLPRSPASVIEGLPAEEGREILADLWARVESSPVRYRAHAGHNQLFVWDGLGTTHTNPPYPRDKARRVWFTIIPAADPRLEPWP